MKTVVGHSTDSVSIRGSKAPIIFMLGLLIICIAAAAGNTSEESFLDEVKAVDRGRPVPSFGPQKAHRTLQMQQLSR
ncbi:MAG: hypothetical protein P8X86_02555 [Desulfofustis sp.]